MCVSPSQQDAAEKSLCEKVHAGQQRKNMSGGIRVVDVEQCELMIAFLFSVGRCGAERFWYRICSVCSVGHLSSHTLVVQPGE